MLPEVRSAVEGVGDSLECRPTDDDDSECVVHWEGSQVALLFRSGSLFGIVEPLGADWSQIPLDQIVSRYVDEWGSPAFDSTYTERGRESRSLMWESNEAVRQLQCFHGGSAGNECMATLMKGSLESLREEFSRDESTAARPTDSPKEPNQELPAYDVELPAYDVQSNSSGDESGDWDGVRRIQLGQP